MRAIVAITVIALTAGAPALAEAREVLPPSESTVAACCAPGDLQCMMRVAQRPVRRSTPAREVRYAPPPQGLAFVYDLLAAPVVEWWNATVTRLSR